MGEKLKGLEERREQMREELAEIGDMRQGSLLKQYRKCGKAQCRCSIEKSYSHGPSFSLTKKVKGKTVTRGIPKGAVGSTEEQIARLREFRRLSQEFLAVNEEICEAKLEEPGEQSDRAEKKSSRRRLKPR